MFAINVLTLNTHKGFSLSGRRFVLPELREAVRQADADLVFLQEVLGMHRKRSRRHADWPAVPQYEYLADTIWTEHAYGRNAAYPHGHHGNALLSRYPILSQRNRDVSLRGDEKRGLLHCVLGIPGRAPELHAICVHLGLREAHRRRQIELLCGVLADDVPATAPLVVAGDFNDWRLTAHARLQRCGLREAFARSHGRPARTFPARWPLLPLDRIYLRHARVEHARVLSDRPWSRLSDHAALAATIMLEPGHPP